MSHHKHHKKSHYSWRGFVNDTSRPFLQFEKEVTGVAKHGIDAFGKIGSSVTTPLLIIGAFGIAFVVLNRGSIR